MKQHTYIAIDLKSFYASVECRERGLDPLDTNLVVADESRTDKTICLAVTPSLKSYGISGRGRLFEVKQRVKEANAGRQHDAPGHRLDGTSHFFSELQADPSLAIDFVIAPPRMVYYMEYSTRIYNVYLKYVAPEDIIVYSIDEVFGDLTGVEDGDPVRLTALVQSIRQRVYKWVGIPTCAGIAPTKTLAKLCDHFAKTYPVFNGVVNWLELTPERQHKAMAITPIKEIWGIGSRNRERLEAMGVKTVLDFARMDASLIRRRFTVVLERTHREILGVSCIPLEDHPQPRHSHRCHLFQRLF